MEPARTDAWDRLATLVLRAKRMVAVFVVLAIAGLAALPLLRFDFSPQTLFEASSEKARIWREHRAKYGADDHHLMLLVEGDLRTPGPWAALAEIEARIAEVDGVEWTRSLLSQPVARSPRPGLVEIAPVAPLVTSSDAEAAALLAAARDHPLLVGTLVSDDGSLACVLFKAEDDVAKMVDVKPVVREIEAIADGVAADVDGVQTWLLGPHAYRVTVVGVMVREEIRFIPLTALVLAIVLWGLFRSIPGVLIPLLSVGLGALWTLAAMALTGQEINVINTITATLVLVIGVADAIHMMIRYGQERREGADRPTATRRALTAVGAACLLTSVTTAVGFATLLSADLEILQRFGLYAAGGVMITFAFTIVFVPWALAHVRADPVVKDPSEGLERGERDTLLGRFLTRQALLVRRRPRAVAAVSLLLAGGFVAGVPLARVDNFIMEYVPRGEPIRDATLLLEEKLSGVVFIDVMLTATGDGETPFHEPALIAAAAAIEDRVTVAEGVQSVASPIGLLRELRYVQRGGAAAGQARATLPASRAEVASLLLLTEMAGDRTLAQTHLDEERRELRITARTADLGARHYLALEQELLQILAEELEGVAATGVITGTSQVGYAGIASLVKDMLRSLAWAFVLIFLTLAVLFRSIRIAALAMIPNVLPLAVVLGGMGWTDRHLETLSAMVFSIGLGIAVDDTIHYIARYMAEVREGRTPEEAVQRTTERTGRAIVYTSLVLVMGFGVLYTSVFPPNQLFAVLGAGVILSALVADLWLLPALLLLFKPKVPGASPAGG